MSATVQQMRDWIADKFQLDICAVARGRISRGLCIWFLHLSPNGCDRTSDTTVRVGGVLVLPSPFNHSNMEVR